MDFSNRVREVKPNAKGASFLAKAKEEYNQLFAAYLEQADRYSSVETYTEALQADAWKLTEQLTKQSWHNGVARGQAGRRSAPSR